MSAQSQKGLVLLKVVGWGALNLFIDVWFLHHMVGWLVFDIIFWLSIVVAVAIGGPGQNRSKSNRANPLVTGDKFPAGSPFWNKPSAAFLQTNVHPLSEGQSQIWLLLLAVPFLALFGGLIYLLYR